MEALDKALEELFKTGIGMLMLSLFVNMFDRKVGHFLKMIAYINLISFVLAIIFSGYAIMNNLIEAINNLTNWKLFGN